MRPGAAPERYRAGNQWSPTGGRGAPVLPPALLPGTPDARNATPYQARHQTLPEGLALQRTPASLILLSCTPRPVGPKSPISTEQIEIPNTPTTPKKALKILLTLWQA